MYECAICALVSTEAPCPACGDDKSTPTLKATKPGPQTPSASQLPFGLDTDSQPESTDLPFGLEENPKSEDSEALIFGIESSPKSQNHNSIPFGLDESPSLED